MSWVRRLLAAALIVIGASALGAVPVLFVSAKVTAPTPPPCTSSACVLSGTQSATYELTAKQQQAIGTAMDNQISLVNSCLEGDGPFNAELTSGSAHTATQLVTTADTDCSSKDSGVVWLVQELYTDGYSFTYSATAQVNPAGSGSDAGSPTTTVTPSGTIPANTCEVIFQTVPGAQVNGNDTFSLSVIDTTPCGPGGNTCSVELGLDGPSQVFAGKCAESGAIWSEITSWASTQETNSNCQSTGLGGNLGCITGAVGHFFSDLTNPDGAITDVLGFILGLFTAAPVFIGELFTGALFTGQGADSIESLYDFILPIGLAFLGLSVGIRFLRLIYQSGQRNMPPFQILMDVVLRTAVATGLMFKGWVIIVALISVSHMAATDIGAGLATNAAAGVSPVGLGAAAVQVVFTVLLSSAVIGTTVGVAGLLAAIPILALIILMLYLTFIMIAASVLILFTSVLAPIFIGAAVLDVRNRFTQWWFAMFTGALLAPIVVALGLGITVKAVTVLMTSTLVPGWGEILGIIFACGGIYFTGRMVSELLKGTFKHGSIMELGAAVASVAVGAAAFGAGAAAGVAGGGSGAMEGLKAAGHHFARTKPGDFSGLGKLGNSKHAGGSSSSSSDGSGVGEEAAMGAAEGVAAGAATMGLLHYASPATREKLALLNLQPQQLHTAMANDPQARQVITRATQGAVPPTASTSQALTHMTQNPERYGGLLNSMVESGDFYSKAAGMSDPGRATFDYSQGEFQNLMGQATRLASRPTPRSDNG